MIWNDSWKKLIRKFKIVNNLQLFELKSYWLTRQRILVCAYVYCGVENAPSVHLL